MARFNGCRFPLQNLSKGQFICSGIFPPPPFPAERVVFFCGFGQDYCDIHFLKKKRDSENRTYGFTDRIDRAGEIKSERERENE